MKFLSYFFAAALAVAGCGSPETKAPPPAGKQSAAPTDSVAAANGDSVNLDETVRLTESRQASEGYQAAKAKIRAVLDEPANPKHIELKAAILKAFEEKYPKDKFALLNGDAFMKDMGVNDYLSGEMTAQMEFRPVAGNVRQRSGAFVYLTFTGDKIEIRGVN